MILQKIWPKPPATSRYGNVKVKMGNKTHLDVGDGDCSIRSEWLWSFQHGKGGNSCNQRCSVLWSLYIFHAFVWVWLTPLKINMSFKKGPFHKECSSNPTIQLSGDMLVFSGVCAVLKKKTNTELGHFLLKTDKLVSHRWLAAQRVFLEALPLNVIFS